MNGSVMINVFYMLSAVLFITGLKQMGSPKTARRGNRLSSFGMLIAVCAALLTQGMSYHWIILGVLIGSAIGLLAAVRVAMTAMPEMVALFNGFGGIASLLVGWAASYNVPSSPVITVSIALSVLIGGVTFTGSLVAWAKLAGRISAKPILYYGQRIVSIAVAVIILGLGIMYFFNPGSGSSGIFLLFILLSFFLGVLAVIPIGGADMPVVISLLNSYSGLAACAAGFALQNTILVVAGSLVGASGIILTQIMCKAMNRSLTHVLFSGFGAAVSIAAGGPRGDIKPVSVEDAYFLLEAARSVVFVPGYGLAVAQAQHAVRELSRILEQRGTDVKFAIHPVAGRMPGHMNVLLAEASVPYDQLSEMDDINPLMASIDVAVVIGANDVVNPAAREDESSPVYGMPIINVDKAKTVIVIKRSMAAGFAGIENNLFYYENTRMLFGDAKTVLQGLISEFKE